MTDTFNKDQQAYMLTAVKAYLNDPDDYNHLIDGDVVHVPHTYIKELTTIKNELQKSPKLFKPTVEQLKDILFAMLLAHLSFQEKSDWWQKLYTEVDMDLIDTYLSKASKYQQINFMADWVGHTYHSLRSKSTHPISRKVTWLSPQICWTIADAITEYLNGPDKYYDTDNYGRRLKASPSTIKNLRKLRHFNVSPDYYPGIINAAQIHNVVFVMAVLRLYRPFTNETYKRTPLYNFAEAVVALLYYQATTPKNKHCVLMALYDSRAFDFVA